MVTKLFADRLADEGILVNEIRPRYNHDRHDGNRKGKIR